MDVYKTTFNRLMSASIKQGDFRPIPGDDIQAMRQSRPFWANGYSEEVGDDRLVVNKHRYLGTVSVGPYRVIKDSPQQQESELKAIGAAAHRAGVAAVEAFCPGGAE